MSLHWFYIGPGLLAGQELRQQYMVTRSASLPAYEVRSRSPQCTQKRGESALDDFDSSLRSKILESRHPVPIFTMT